MERTINQIPVSTVFQKLKEDIPNVIGYMQNDSKPYLDAKLLKNHFEKHVPQANYDFRVSDLQFAQIKERACFTCIGTMVIYDDHRQKIIEKSSIGGSNVIISNKNGEAPDLAMDAKNAAVNAHKGCITQLGCGKRQLDEAKAEYKRKNNSAGNPKGTSGSMNRSGGNATSHSGRSQGTQTNPNKPKTGEGNFRLVLDKATEIHDGPKFYLIPVLCRDYRNYRTSLLIWKDGFKNIQEVLNFIQSGLEFICNGKFEAYGNQYRIVFKKFASNSR